jgi:hypothetical protein
MLKRISNKHVVQNAISVNDTAVSQSEVNPATISLVMAQMGRKGGRIGGKRRLETMTPGERSRVASIAARARWAKKKGPNPRINQKYNGQLTMATLDRVRANVLASIL